MSNLLEKASIVTTPTAYDNGKILSVKPTGGIGDFDFTRNSSATRVNSQGLIEDVQILSSNLVSNGDFSQEGSELITNGDFATDSDWSKGTGWSISGGSANYNTSSNNNLSQLGGFVDGKTYKVTLEVKSYVRGVPFVSINSGASVQVPRFVGIHTMYLVAGTSATKIFRYYGGGFGSGGEGSIDNVSVKEVGQDWILSANADIQNNGLNLNGSGTFVLGQQLLFSSGLYNGKKVKLTYEVVANDLIGTGNLRVGGYSGASLFPSLINLDESIGNHTIYTTINSTGSNNVLDLYITGGYTSGKITITNISVIEITDDTNLPRIDYTGGTGHWLFEPQSTNLITQSENLSNMQIAFGGAITLDSNFINPSGQKGCYFIYDTDGGTQSRFRVSNSGFTLGDKLSYSVFLKSNSSSLITIGGNYGGENCTFNVGTKTLISQGAAVNSYEIINFTNGWTRYIVNTTFTNTVPGDAYPFFTTNATLSEKIYLWGHQLEVQSFATSYIPTNGSTVTRLQDAAFGSGSSDLINSTEGVLYAEVSLNLLTPNMYIQISDGTYSNRVAIINNNSSNSWRVFYRVNGSSQIDVTASGLNTFETNKIAISWKLNEFKFYVNGIKITQVNSGSVNPTNTFNRLEFKDIVSNNFYGKTKCVAVFKEALTDAELTCLTTI